MKKRSICWNITSKCNENCNFCYRILTDRENDIEKNKKILELLIKLSAKKISWTGGEALLYPNIVELLKIAKLNGITNNLLTNGKGLTKEKIIELEPYLEYITLPYDSNNGNTCKVMGRGEEHSSKVVEILDFVQNNNISIKIKINTLVSKINKEDVIDIGNTLKKYKIERWKLFKFMPLRNYAINNEKDFYISEKEFNNIILNVENLYGNYMQISECNEDKIQKNYLLINPVGDFIITENFRDKKIYNIEDKNNDSLKKYM